MHMRVRNCNLEKNLYKVKKQIMINLLKKKISMHQLHFTYRDPILHHLIENRIRNSIALKKLVASKNKPRIRTIFELQQKKNNAYS